MPPSPPLDPDAQRSPDTHPDPDAQPTPEPQPGPDSRPDSDPQPEPDPQPSQPRTGVASDTWATRITSFAAMVSSLGVLLGAVVGFLGLPIWFESPTAAAPTVATPAPTVTVTKTIEAPRSEAPTTGPTEVPDTPSPTAPTATSQESGVLWSGEIVMTDARSDWDLDTAPPSAVHSKEDLSGTDSSLVVTSEDETGFNDADMTITTSGPQTTEAQCVDRLQTHAVQSLGVPAGRTFCLKTKAGRTALVTVTAVRGALDADLQIKVWNDSSGS